MPVCWRRHRAPINTNWVHTRFHRMIIQIMQILVPAGNMVGAGFCKQIRPWAPAWQMRCGAVVVLKCGVPESPPSKSIITDL
jgi:hypothetical protein